MADRFLTAPLTTSKDGRLVNDAAKDRTTVFTDNDESVAQMGKNDDDTFGLKVEIGGVSVGSTTVNANVTQTITITVTPLTGSTPIVSSWDDTFYKDSITTGNEYEVFSGGGAWSGLTKANYEINIFNSWGLTDNINVKHVAMFKNHSGSSVNTLYVGQMRVISLGGAAS